MRLFYFLYTGTVSPTNSQRRLVLSYNLANVNHSLDMKTVAQNTVRRFSLPVAVAALTLVACEEDAEVSKMTQPKDTTVVVPAVIAPPTLSLQPSSIASVIKFDVNVTANQVQDTVYYLVLEDTVTAPTRQEFTDYPSVTEFPMTGNYSRTAFRSDLRVDTPYVVYALIRHETQLSEIAILTVTTGAAPDATGADNKPEDNAATLKAPVLERRGVPQDDLISLAVSVENDQKDGTIYYLYFKEKDHMGQPTSQELMDHRLREEILMNGATTKKFNFVAASQTKYFVYAMIQLGDEVSSVVLLEVDTI